MTAASERAVMVCLDNGPDRRQYAYEREKNEIGWLPYTLVDGGWVSSASWRPALVFADVTAGERFAERMRLRLPRLADRIIVVRWADHTVVSPPEARARALADAPVLSAADMVAEHTGRGSYETGSAQ